MTETDVERLAAVAGVPIDPDERAAVAAAVELVFQTADLVMESRLPDNVLPALVFRP